MDNGSMVDQFDPFITVTFDFPKDLNASYKRSIRKSIFNTTRNVGAKPALSANPEHLSVEVRMSKFPFMIESVSYWFRLVDINWS